MSPQEQESESDFYLYFNEGFHDEEPRLCTRIKVVSFGAASKIGALIVRVYPPCSGELDELEEPEINLLLLSPLFAGQSFFPVEIWPMQVHIYLPLVDSPELRDHINLAETKNIALGEIHTAPKVRT